MPALFFFFKLQMALYSVFYLTVFRLHVMFFVPSFS
jgi:hypothetical protein